MTSRLRAALISSAALVFLLSGLTEAGVIRSVRYSGAAAISDAELAKRSLLRTGEAYSDSLVSHEAARIDSLYFSIGFVGAQVSIDTSAAADGVDVLLVIREGEPARIGSVSVSGAELIGSADAAKRVRPLAGERFDPFALEESLRGLLMFYNESGYPYAQVWLTGFQYLPATNEVELTVSVSEGECSRIARVVFDGIAKTDSSIALRISRLEPGSMYGEKRVASATKYLRGSGYFESVGEARLERPSSGAVDVVISVREIERSNLFQGAIGFSRNEQGDYVLNGSIDLELRNIAGTGRRARFNWLNDGERYSKFALKFREPFLFSSMVSLDAELSQVIEDSVYMWNSGGLYAGIPLGPALSLVAGAAADRNVPSSGELLRSVRERFRVGVASAGPAEALAFSAFVEGAYRKSYFTENRSERDGELLYRVEGSAARGAWRNQSVFARFVAEAVHATGEIPLAELFPLGGATTLRGYREGQFRGERVVFANFEYRFGEGGWLFLFDDVGAYFRGGDGWTARNGAGFGLRSESPRGIVVLSFGVGEELSLEGTRIHISLIEKF
jgi:outer membrane protein insertion porin family